MKKLITLVLIIYSYLSNLNAQTNLIMNPSFEDAAYTFLVDATDGASLPNQLRRISSITAIGTSASYPAPSSSDVQAVDVVDGLWLKMTNFYNTVYCQRSTSAAANSTTYSLLMKVLGNSSSSGIDWTTFSIQQRLSLDNKKKYTLTFYANTSSSVGNPTYVAYIADKSGVIVANVTSKTFTPTIKSLTKYTATFDLPSAIAGNPTLDYSTAYVGVGLNPTYSSELTQSSALYLDEFSLIEAASTSVTNIFSNSKVYSVNNEIVIEGCSSQNLSIYSGLGQLLKSIQLNSDRVSVPVKNGLYLVNIGDKNYKVLVK